MNKDDTAVIISESTAMLFRGRDFLETIGCRRNPHLN
jgi:hypothetical protein